MIDFRLNETQTMLQQSARAALQATSPSARVRAWEDSDAGYDRDVYRDLAQLGWLGVLLPDDLGGQNGWIEAAIIFEECGRALLPGPYFGAMQAAQLLARFGANTTLIDEIVSGQMTISPAFWERSAKSSLIHITTTARLIDGTATIDGEKVAVEFGHSVDSLLVAVMVEDWTMPLALAIVDRNAPGVSASRINSLGGEPRSLVTLSDVRVPVANLVPITNVAAFDDILLQTRLLRAAEICGMAAAAMDLAVSYAKVRVQYGHPIGTFQAIQHKLADADMRRELARAQVYYAAWRLSEEIDPNGPVAEAVLRSGEMGLKTISECVQTHGGLGITEGSDVSLYFRRAKQRQPELGYPDQLRERIAVAAGL